MSTNLEWEPVGRKRHHLPDQLKYVLRKRYGEPVNIVFDSSYEPYLNGLKDANIDGAEALILAIEKYGEISVKEYG